MTKPLIIYHSNCNDGSTAAACAYTKFLDEAEYYPATHGSIFDVNLAWARDVYFLDFCFPRDLMSDIWKTCKKMIILDHHKTAQDALRGLEFEGKFDMEHSGARLAFDYFCEGRQLGPLEEFVNYVEDRDLWKHQLPKSKEINDYLFSLPPFTHETAKEWIGVLCDRTGIFPYEAIRLGKGINRYKEKQLGLAIERAFKAEMFGMEVWVTNDTHLFSEVANKMADKGPFGVCYYINSDGAYVYSLRSKIGTEVDVSELAKSVGGGGHKHAAGCASKKPLHKKIEG